MRWLINKWKFILGLFAALGVLSLSLQSKRHNSKRLQHEETINTLLDMEEQGVFYEDEILKHSQKAAKHTDAATDIKKQAEAKIKKIKEQDNETISDLADKWNSIK